MSRAVMFNVSQVMRGVRSILFSCLFVALCLPVMAEDMSWCAFTDISTEMDGKVNLGDFTVLAGHWLSACDPGNMWCDRADFDRMDGVDINDLMTLVGCWCAEDGEPPSQDPALWQVSPQLAFGTVDTVEMVAAQVSGNPSFAVGRQEVLFSVADYLFGNGRPQYDVSPDDQRFVLLRIGTAAGTDPILVEGFFEELQGIVER